MQSQQRFEFSRIPQTESAARTFIEELDLTIEEVANNLQLLQAVRRATASAFGIDRREDSGDVARMHDRARRAEYEGEGEDPRRPDGKLRVAQ